MFEKVYSKDYLIGGVGSVFNGNYSGRDPVILPGISYMNNAVDCLIAACKEDNNFPILLRNRYGNGTIYTLAIPDDYADVYKYPTEVLTTIRQYLMSDLGIYIECGEKVGLFLYNNGTFILESFLGHSCKIKIHMTGGDRKLIDVKNGMEISAVVRKESESIFEVPIQPVFYKVFRVI